MTQTILLLVVCFAVAVPGPADAKGIFGKVKKIYNDVKKEVEKHTTCDTYVNKIDVDHDGSWLISSAYHPKIKYTHTLQLPCLSTIKLTKKLEWGQCKITHTLWRHCARVAAPYHYGNDGSGDNMKSFVYNTDDPDDIRNGLEIPRARLCLYEDVVDILDTDNSYMPFHLRTKAKNIFTDPGKALIGYYADVYSTLAEYGIYYLGSTSIWGNLFGDSVNKVAQSVISYIEKYTKNWIESESYVNLTGACTTQSCVSNSSNEGFGVAGCVDLKLPWGPPPFYSKYIVSGFYPEITPICEDWSHSSDLVSSAGCLHPTTEESSFYAPRYEVRMNDYVSSCTSENQEYACVNFKNFSGATPQRVGVCGGNDIDPCVEAKNFTLGDGQYRVSYNAYYSDGTLISADTSRLATESSVYLPAMIDTGEYAEIVGTPDSSEGKNSYTFNQAQLAYTASSGVTYSATVSAEFDEDDGTQVCFYKSSEGEDLTLLTCEDRPSTPEPKVEEVSGSTAESPLMKVTLGEGDDEASIAFTVDDIGGEGQEIHAVTFVPTLLYPKGYYIDVYGDVQCDNALGNCLEVAFDNYTDCRSIPGLRVKVSETENDDGTYDLEYEKGAAYMCINNYEGDGSTYIVKKMKTMEYLDNNGDTQELELPSLWPSIDEWNNDVYYPSSKYTSTTDDVIAIVDGTTSPTNEQTIGPKSPLAYLSDSQPNGLCIPVTTQYEDLLSISSLTKTEAEVRAMSLNSLRTYRSTTYPDGEDNLDYYIRCREYFYDKDGYDVADSATGLDTGGDCPGDYYALKTGIQSIISWPSASIGQDSNLTLTATTKDKVCGLLKSSYWESDDDTTAVLTRTCQADGKLSTEIKLNGEVITDAGKLLSCVPKQQTIKFFKADKAFAYTNTSTQAKSENYKNIDDRTSTAAYSINNGYRSVVFGMLDGASYTFDKDRCYAYYVPYEFTIDGTPSEVLEGFNLLGFISVSDALSVVSNETLIKTYKEGDITDTGRIFYGYGQSSSKIDYCKTSTGITDVLTCYASGALNKAATDCNGESGSALAYTSMLGSLKSGANKMYLIYAIRKEGSGYIMLNYKFKTESVSFLD